MGRGSPLARFGRSIHHDDRFLRRRSSQRSTWQRARRWTKDGVAIWNLVDTSIREGFFGAPTNSEINDVNIRLVFPWLVRSSLTGAFKLKHKVYRDLISDVMFPLLREQPWLRGDVAWQVPGAPSGAPPTNRTKDRDRGAARGSKPSPPPACWKVEQMNPWRMMFRC